MSAASPGDVGWVYIATPQKLAVVTCTGVALPLLPAALSLKSAALPQLPETAQVISRKTS
jgi:hypothetical protein